MKTKCMSCGGSMKKMAVGGTTTKRIIKKSTGGMYGIPQENLGTSGQYGFAQKGGGVTSGIAKKIINTAKKSKPNIQNLYDKNGNKKSKAQFILQQMKTDLKNKTVKKYQKGGVTKADPYGVLNEKKRYDKSGGNMGPTKIVRKKVDPKAPKPSRKRTVERNGTFAMQKGGPIKAIKKVIKKITRPLKKAQNGIEMDDNMMINKPGYSGGYSKGAVSEVPVTPVRPRINSGSIPEDYKRVGIGKPGIDRGKPGMRKPSFGPSMGKPTVENWLEAKKKYGYVEPTSKEKPVSDYYKKGGATKAAKFAALAPPYNKATFADKIVGAKRKAKKK